MVPYHKNKVLVVDDEPKIQHMLATILRDAGYEVETSNDGREAINKCLEFDPRVAVVDLQMPNMNGLEVISQIKERNPRIIAIILTAHGTIQSAVRAIKEGIYDYLTKPFDNEEIVLAIKRAFEVYRLKYENDQLREELRMTCRIENIIGNSGVIRGIRDEIKRVSGNDATVLIEGESGTGKELVARAIHHESIRRDGPLVIVDCGAIPANLIESEFFGHEKGAFTDAREQRVGKFEEAHSGSIFLDEIAELPLGDQTRLLRTLQEREIVRVGSSNPIKIDVRVIAATNKDLEMKVKEGTFREDLFYRLNVLKIQLPPLREHKEDIPTYVQHFITKYRDSFQKKVSGFTREAQQLLSTREWRGNIRELENAIQRALLNATGDRIDIPDLAFLERRAKPVPPLADSTGGLDSYIQSVVPQLEKEVILETLRQANWNRTETAARLLISRKTLFNKMRKYGIHA
jgi:two-component system, NtrC family, response regulator AtoC